MQEIVRELFHPYSGARKQLIHVSIVVENVAVLDLYWHAEVIGMNLQLELGF